MRRKDLALVNAAGGLLLLVAGGMVTSTDSGLAVPDWPLSYGTWLPAMVGGVFFEHGHRLLAALLGLLILIMAFWTQRAEPRRGVRLLAWATLAAVCVQGVLGGVTVYYGLPLAVSAAHAVLGQSVFCALVVMAELVGEGAERPAGERPTGTLKPLAVLACAALWAQLVLGSILRHGGRSIVWHLLGAAVAVPAAGLLGAAVLRDRREPALTAPAAALLLLLAVQLGLGLATADFRSAPNPRASYAMIAAATTHLAVGAFLLASCVLLASRIWRLRLNGAS